MLYAITYEIEGICGPGGYVSATRNEALTFAREMAEVALGQLGDGVSCVDWFDFNGEADDPRGILSSNDLDEVAYAVEQINDAMQSQNIGYIGLLEYQDLFHFIEDQNVVSWCSKKLKDRIVSMRNYYSCLTRDIASEWLEK